MILQTIFELAAAVLVVLCFVYEDKLIAFENRIAASYREHRAQKGVRK